MSESPPLHILITGCSAGGIGSALAEALASRGHHVFATLRNSAKISPALSALSNVSVLELDITSSVSIAAAVETVAKATDGKGLDILVNNAGAGYPMPLLDVDIDMAKGLFETNVWGVLATTKAFMEQLVRTRGTVVNISSVGGEVHTPWIGIYSASKAATTMLSETLRLEVAPFGVHVQTVMVGVIKTNFHAEGHRLVLPPGSRYQAIKDTITKWAAGEAGLRSISAEAFAAQLVKDILSKKSGRIYRGPSSSAASFCARYLPQFVLVRLDSAG
ncbi:hypothetical protein BDV95DRAFT_480089 [Massariosphaeria phaeospora]|uniref:Oxidoreductase n=1 Tax=Massariosphaeria phaeospora TaxID=100035 RepID=A0A7C8IF11_9PLEO|nr:hypothetical protein BDV95DRAFT_480089 [Massariosphaeria phaeospora]